MGGGGVLRSYSNESWGTSQPSALTDSLKHFKHCEQHYWIWIGCNFRRSTCISVLKLYIFQPQITCQAQKQFPPTFQQQSYDQWHLTQHKGLRSCTRSHDHLRPAIKSVKFKSQCISTRDKSTTSVWRIIIHIT